MSQHVSETCNGSDGLWLPLTEYSVKSGISTSTIRRKIKSNSISYRLENGRYLILYSDTHNLSARQLPVASVIDLKSKPEESSRFAVLNRPVVKKEESVDESQWALPLVERAVQMVSEAFDRTLKEKDERIRLLEKWSKELEERLNELRLLVRVLEEKYEVRY